MLFITFLISGIALFAGIYLYSIFQLKQQKPSEEVFDSAKPKQGIISKIFEKFPRNRNRDSDLFDKDEALRKNDVHLKTSLETDSEDNVMSIGGVVAKVSSKEPVFEKPVLSETHTDIIAEKKLSPEMKTSSSIEDIVQLPVSEAVDEPVSSIDSTAIESESCDAVPLDQLAKELENRSSVEQSHASEFQGEIQSDSFYQQDLLLDQEHLSESSHYQEGDVERLSQDNFQQSEETNTFVEDRTREQDFKANANAIEIVAKVSGPESIARDKCLALYRRYDYLFTRNLGIFGRNSLTHIWENMELADQSAEFDDIAVSLQLADKSGAMTRKESNTFSTLALEFADTFSKKMVFSMDVDNAVEKGRMLDELARKYDAMVVSNIIPKRRRGFRSTDIRSCTRDLQMVQSKNGVFGRFDQVENVASLRYSLAIAGADGKYIPVSGKEPFQVEDIVVFLNVPLVKNPLDAFDLMIKDARKLAAWLDGKIVDKNGKNITSSTLEKLAEQISVIEKEMELDGLVPGEALCKKLF